MKEIIINDHKWKYHGIVQAKDNKYHHYTSNWLCTDNDRVVLYIQEEEKTMTLECFTGIPGQEINIDEITFPYISYQEHFRKQGLTLTEEFMQNCLIISDYFCSFFCEYIN